MAPVRSRQAKKILRDLKVLHLERGDVLVLTPRERLSSSQEEAAGRALNEAFPGHKILVSRPGFQFSAIREVTP
jgi:hypothetical protein